jgi:RimJ/RimL family protein N-acetyltransferase
VLGVAMNLRFHPGVATVHRIVSEGTIGRPLRASVWCGSWLPGWRPDGDYRDTYSAQRRLGGGVLLDAIHELDYAIWTLGPVRRVRGVLAHVSPLELDVEDLATLVLEHTSGAVTDLTLDYFDRAYNRGCRIVGELGTVSWRWEEEVVVHHSSQGEVERVAAASDVDPSYRAQLEYFLAAVASGGAAATSAGEAAAALAVADAARVSSAGMSAATVIAPELALRPATLADAECLLRWRNDSAVRGVSFQQDEIQPDEHRAWLEHKLADPTVQLFVASAGETPVGQLRLEMAEQRTVELHIALAPEARGRGLAAPLLTLAACERAPALGATRVLARVKENNERSLRSFRSAGFRERAGEPDERLFELLPQSLDTLR